MKECLAPLLRVPAAFYVNASAGVMNLTAEQIIGIYGGRIQNWKDVGGADQRIRVVRLEEPTAPFRSKAPEGMDGAAWPRKMVRGG